MNGIRNIIKDAISEYTDEKLRESGLSRVWKWINAHNVAWITGFREEAINCRYEQSLIHFLDRPMFLEFQKGGKARQTIEISHLALTWRDN